MHILLTYTEYSSKINVIYSAYLVRYENIEK